MVKFKLPFKDEARQCPECGSVYLPDNGIHCETCECEDKVKPTRRVFVNIISLEK